MFFYTLDFGGIVNFDDYEIISNSNEFDYEYYINKYDIHGVDPIIHYLEEGAKKGFNPSADFNTEYYLRNNTDVNINEVNPFVHYLLWGKKENRDCDIVGLDQFTHFKSFKGKENFVFSLDSENEILQFFDSNHRSKFNSTKFNKKYDEKKDFFNKINVIYDFFVIPDRSVICRDYLPFHTGFIKRNLNLTSLSDFSRFLNYSHYFKDDTRLNLDGAKEFTYHLIHSFDIFFNQEDFERLLNIHKLDRIQWNSDITDNSPEYIVSEIPTNLIKKIHIDDNIEQDLQYFKNEDSFCEKKLLVFHDDGIKSLKPFLSFYFREIIFCKEKLNNSIKDMIELFDPDCVFELYSEKNLETYDDTLFNDEYKNIFGLFNLNGNVSENYFKIIEKYAPNPKVSVIIPVYNTYKYLNDCLKSIFNQSIDEFEVICINDGSTDNSLDILKKYMVSNENLRVFSVENNGQGAARNFGLTLARGEYIYFLDSDDWVFENTLKNLYTKSKNDDLELLFYQSRNYLDNKGTFYETDLDNFKCLDEHFGEEIIFNHNDTKDFIFEIPVNPVAKLYKKSFLEEYNLEFPTGMYFEDNTFFYRVYFKCERAGFLREKFYNRRVRDGSVTTILNKSTYDIIKANNKIIETFIEEKQYEKYKEQLVNHCFDNIFYFFNRFSLELKYEFYELMRNNFLGFTSFKGDFLKYLEEEKLVLFNLILKNKYYLDYLSDYKLLNADYMIFDGEEYYFKDSAKYFEKKDDSNKYKLSVIIPIYNNEKVIHRTLRSIINQTLGVDNIEVLLINDCSKDNTKLVLDDYTRQYESFKSIHITESTGAAGTPRNIGIYESSTDYIIFLDHDDFFELDALEFLYKNMEKNDVDMVYGVWSEIIEGKRYDRIYSQMQGGYFKNLWEYESLIAHPAPSIWTKLFKKDFIIKNNILFPTILGEDAIFLSKALIKAEGILFFNDKVLCYHDLSDDSTTNNVTLKYLTEGFVSELYMFDYYKDLNKENFYKIRTEGIIDFFIKQFIGSKLDDTEIEQIFDLFKEFCKKIDYYDAKPRNIRNRYFYDFIMNDDVLATIKFKKMLNDEDNKNNE